MNNKKFQIIRIFSLFLFSFVFIRSFSYAYSDYVWSTLSNETIETSSSIESDDSSNPLGLDCGSCILIEQSTRKNFVFV